MVYCFVKDGLNDKKLKINDTEKGIEIVRNRRIYYGIKKSANA